MAAHAATLTLTHQTSRRVTAGISFHSFNCTPDGTPGSTTITSSDFSPDGSTPHVVSPPTSTRWLRPTQNVTLQFPESLDPAGGRHGMSVEDRRCTFTPCHVGGTALPRRDATSWALSILTRNGRITGLLGLPRPYQTLKADVVDVGGGFSPRVLDDASVCIAGGTGIAPFLTMGAASMGRCTLCWSIRSDDFGAVEFVLQEQLLRVDQWEAVSIFVTSGEDAGGLVVEKPAMWWETQFAELWEKYSGRLRLQKRRMGAEDLAVRYEKGLGETRTILFCGSKSLEWQIRMWFMGTAAVHCTEIA